MFLLLLLVVLLAVAGHAARLPTKTTPRIAELGLRYLLVGYCGLPMIILSVVILVAPERATDYLHLPDGGMLLAFLGWGCLGMSLAAVLALVFRGDYLTGPAVVWGTFFAGATVVHIQEFLAHGHLTFAVVLHTLLTHAVVAALLFGALLASRLSRGSP